MAHRTHVTFPPTLLAKLKRAFLARVCRKDGHCVWTGNKNREWPCLVVGSRAYGAAKALWLVNGGVILGGQHLWKRCSAPLCVNPRHYSTAPPAWSPRRRAAEERRKVKCYAEHIFGRRNAPGTPAATGR